MGRQGGGPAGGAVAGGRRRRRLRRLVAAARAAAAVVDPPIVSALLQLFALISPHQGVARFYLVDPSSCLYTQPSQSSCIVVQRVAGFSFLSFSLNSFCLVAAL